MKRYQFFKGDDTNLPEWVGKCDSEYEVIVDMIEKKEICCLTEPEDRSFMRDLAPLLELLNILNKKD